MEEFIRSVISKYNDFKAEAILYEKWLSKEDDPDTRNHLTYVQLKVAVIEAWLNLLNADEKFVVQKHLIEEMEWPRVAFEYREQWKNEFTRTERSLQVYQANALSKIAALADKNREIMFQLFSDMPTASVIKE